MSASTDIVERLDLQRPPSTRGPTMDEPLTAAQVDLLRRMGDIPHALRNGDEHRPMWWIEGGGAARGSVAGALIRKGLIRYTAKWGGQPGILGFTITDLGRAALAQETRHGE